VCSSDLDLELELTESGTRQTVILQACSVAEELIDADSFSPTSGYPSFIFQALTAAATNATTSLVPITGLDWTAQANSEYLVEWGLLVRNAGNGNFDGKISVPTGSLIFGKWISSDEFNARLSPTPFNFGTETIFAQLNDDEECASIQKAYIITGETAGTVSFEFAKNVIGITAAANEIQTGSWVRAEKVK
jgi:hypothetical protein